MLVHNKNHCFRTRSGIKDKIKQQNKFLTTYCNLRKKIKDFFCKQLIELHQDTW